MRLSTIQTSRAWLNRLKPFRVWTRYRSSFISTGRRSWAHCRSTGTTETFGSRILWMRSYRLSESEEDSEQCRVLVEKNEVKARELVRRLWIGKGMSLLGYWSFIGSSVMEDLNEDKFYRICMNRIRRWTGDELGITSKTLSALLYSPNVNRWILLCFLLFIFLLKNRLCFRK